jgi:N-acetylmuramoyl-L-alanine amidase
VKKTHTVAQGECMASIGHAHGYDDWEPIYDDADNAQLRQARPNPHVLCPGDEVHLPNIGRKRIEVAAGSRTTIRLSRALKPVFCSIKVSDINGVALGDAKFSLTVSDRVIEGTLGPNGELAEQIPPNEHKGELVVRRGDDDVAFRAVLHFGHLDPIGTITGVRGRLLNLGYPCGPIVEQLDEELEAALRWFQEVCGLAVDGKPNEETRSELVKQFGA